MQLNEWVIIDQEGPKVAMADKKHGIFGYEVLTVKVGDKPLFLGKPEWEALKQVAALLGWS